MRALGIALVLASLALGTGGVAYRPQAQAQAPSPAPEAAAPDAEQEICRARPEEIQVRRARIAAPQVTRRIVSLGTRGYNYARPGDPVPTAVTPAAPAKSD
jgi:hypothetical protein